MNKKLIALVMTCMLAMLLAVGCSSNTSSSSSSSSGSSASSQQATERTISDMAGREVTIPTNVDSVYCAVPTGEAAVCTLAPTKLVGWVNEPTDESLGYLPSELQNLPVIGGWMGGKVTANIEDIIALDPDVIVYMGSQVMSNTDEIPDQIQKDTGIPVVVVSSDLEETSATYRNLGDWLGESERGEKLAAYCDEKLDAVAEQVAKVPADKQISVYYAENADGLSTEPSGSSHVAVLDYCKVKNVAVGVELKSGMGMTPVSIEQVIQWNPQMILCHSGYVLSTDIKNNAQWADIQAVQNGDVYTTPAVPFNWFDRPPNPMRVMGIQWFAKLCYPDYVDIDVDQEVRDFYELFYNVTLTDEQVSSLINQDEISFRQ